MGTMNLDITYVCSAEGSYYQVCLSANNKYIPFVGKYKDKLEAEKCAEEIQRDIDHENIMLTHIVERFVSDNRISCPEKIYQSDKVSEKALDFICELVSEVGFCKLPE